LLKGEVKNWKDGAVAFGIGAVAGFVAGATGGASLVGSGFLAASVGGGIITGATSALAQSAISQMGNAIYFHDPISIEQMAVDGVTGGITMGLTNGLAYGWNWTGKIIETPTLESLGMGDMKPEGWSSTAAGGGDKHSDDLVKAAQESYPKKAGLTELHHIAPKYLGGATNGALVPLDGAYHQVITNEFRSIYPYGLPTPGEARMLEIMKQVYSKYPLPLGY
jgi:hypothetical protein